MKRSAFLFMGILLFAVLGCGGGGSGTTTSGIPGGSIAGGTGGGGDVVTGPVGYITISMLSPNGPAPNVPVDNQSALSSLRDHFRVVVRQTADLTFYDDDNNPFIVRTELRRIVQDNTIPGTLQIAVPPGAGYTVELLTYKQVGSIRNMLQYGQSDNTFSIISGANTTVPVTLNPVSQYITMTAPDNVVTGFSYSVSINKTVPLRSLYYLSQYESTSLWPNIGNFVDGYGTGTQRTAPSVSFTAPTVSAASNLYLQGQFFIDDSLLSDQELLPATPPAWSNWRINCPDNTYTAAVKSILLLPGTIQVIIN